ncbi:family 16 glycosylhydrolase [Kitasatospora sp. NPDC001664]
MAATLRRPRRLLGVLLPALAAVLTLAGPTAARTEPAAVTPAPAAAAAAVTTWADEFNGPSGAAPDPGKWTMETGGSGFGNHELQYYTGGNANAAQDGQGNLVITARRNTNTNLGCWYGTCQYTSARMNTAQTFTQAYGHFESRIKIPRGQGIWPAFWMLGNDLGSVGWPNSGEIDIMENIGREPSTVHGTLHGPGYSGAAGLGSAYSLPGGQAFADAFHVFAVDWSPGSITWSVDGQAYRTRTTADTNGNRWVFDHPFFLILNLAVGGDWPGSPDGSSTYPQTMTVDYVRASTSNGGPTRTGQISGIGGMCVDVAGASSADHTPIQLHNCTGNAAQQWTTGDGTVRALGKCLDVDAANSADGTAIQLYTCNGTNAQQWSINGDGTVRALGKCLDAAGGSSADGTRLILWTCNGGANQRWTLG